MEDGRWKMEDNLELLTIEEAANLLKVNKATLRRWTDNNLLSCQRIGPRKERRFQRIDLVVFNNLCHSFNINAQALRSNTLCPIHLISMKPLKTYRQEKT